MIHRDRRATARDDLEELAAAGATYLVLVVRVPRLIPCGQCRPLVGQILRIDDTAILAALDCPAGCLSIAPLNLE